MNRGMTLEEDVQRMKDEVVLLRLEKIGLNKLRKAFCV